MPGAVFGAAFVEFVPNIAEQIDKNAPGVLYGMLLMAALLFHAGGRGGRPAHALRRPALRRPARTTSTTKPQGGTIHAESTHAADGRRPRPR